MVQIRENCCKSWLTQLTHNLCIDIHRERHRGARQVESLEAIAFDYEQELVSQEEISQSPKRSKSQNNVQSEASNGEILTLSDALESLQIVYREEPKQAVTVSDIVVVDVQSDEEVGKNSNINENFLYEHEYVNIAIPTFVRYSYKELTADRRGWTQMDADNFVPQQTRKRYKHVVFYLINNQI